MGPWKEDEESDVDSSSSSSSSDSESEDTEAIKKGESIVIDDNETSAKQLTLVDDNEPTLLLPPPAEPEADEDTGKTIYDNFL